MNSLLFRARSISPYVPFVNRSSLAARDFKGFTRCAVKYNFNALSTNSNISRNFATSKGSVPAVTSADLFSQTFKEGEKVLSQEKEAPVFNKRKFGGHIKRVRQPDEAWAKLSNVKTSKRKLDIIAYLIRGQDYMKARRILLTSQRRIAQTVVKTLESCRYNAENNHNLNPEKLYVSECWTGKGRNIKAIRYHAKGRHGLMIHPYSQLWIILKERKDKPDQDETTATEIAASATSVTSNQQTTLH